MPSSAEKGKRRVAKRTGTKKVARKNSLKNQRPKRKGKKASRKSSYLLAKARKGRQRRNGLPPSIKSFLTRSRVLRLMTSSSRSSKKSMTRTSQQSFNVSGPCITLASPPKTSLNYRYAVLLLLNSVHNRLIS